jgi:RNA polymerase sigma-70 factor (ECF subfamily)
VEAAPVKETEPVGPAPTFDEFFRSEYRRVVALASVLCGRTGVAEELAQDAFVAAYRHWDRVSRYDDPAAWVRRVVVNLSTSTLRRRSREARALTRLALRRPTEAVRLAGLDDEFWAAVRDLPRRQSQCIALRYLDDRSVDEIAAVLGIAPATVRVHLHSARSALAARLGETDDEEMQ